MGLDSLSLIQTVHNWERMREDKRLKHSTKGTARQLQGLHRCGLSVDSGQFSKQPRGTELNLRIKQEHPHLWMGEIKGARCMSFFKSSREHRKWTGLNALHLSCTELAKYLVFIHRKPDRDLLGGSTLALLSQHDYSFSRWSNRAGMILVQKICRI